MGFSKIHELGTALFIHGEFGPGYVKWKLILLDDSVFNQKNTVQESGRLYAPKSSKMTSSTTITVIDPVI